MLRALSKKCEKQRGGYKRSFPAYISKMLLLLHPILIGILFIFHPIANCIYVQLASIFNLIPIPISMHL